VELAGENILNLTRFIIESHASIKTSWYNFTPEKQPMTFLFPKQKVFVNTCIMKL